MINISKSPTGIMATGLVSIDALNKRYSVTGIEKVFKNKILSSLSNVYKLTLWEEINILDVVREYEKDAHVEYAEPNYIYHTCVIPNDPDFDSQWALDQSSDHDIDAPEAWDIERGNESIAGVCWNCTIMPIKGLNSEGTGHDTELSNAIVYAADNGADVISMSWGSYYYSRLLNDVINYAYNKGVVPVSIAGNNNVRTKSYPAAYENVIAVAATDSSDAKASFSNYGSWIDVAAPGVNIYSTYFNDTYTTLSGTSMSCPHVAGIIGLILSKNHGFNPEEVRTILRSTTDNITSSSYIGIGRVNSYKALLRNSTPIANLNSSLDDATVSGTLDISGTANGSTFVNYTVYYGQGIYPSSWTKIDNSSSPVNDSILASWDTTILTDGFYTIRLILSDNSGFTSEDRAIFFVNNIINTLYVGGSGPCNYSSINAAINDAEYGDAIYVFNGTYYEHVVMHKSILLMGENKETTIIDGNYTGNPIDIQTDYVILNKFSIRNSGGCSNTGIRIHGSNNIIKNCTVYNNGIGIKLWSSSNNIITNCTVYNNSIGIKSSSSLCDIITNCTVYNSPDIGVYLYKSINNKLRDLVINNNSRNFGVIGFDILHYYHDIDTSNIVNGKPIYYIIEQNGLTLDDTLQIGYLGLISCANILVENLTFTKNLQGLLLANTSHSTIINCTIYNSKFGIYLDSCIGNSLINCTVYNSSSGIHIEESSSCQNIISHCTVYSSNIYGICIPSSHNVIFNCTLHSQSSGIILLYNNNNFIKNCTFYSNYDGIELVSASNTTVTRCFF